MRIERNTLGIGDRFAHQGQAQLRAMVEARAAGIDIRPVWNKSNREHEIVGSRPGDVRAEADAAVAAVGWDSAYYVDADPVNRSNVHPSLPTSDFFTLDVADAVDEAPAEADARAFVEANRRYTGTLRIPGIETPFEVTDEVLREIAGAHLAAIRQARDIYEATASAKGEDAFVTEVSIDATDRPQTPVELFFILSMIAAEGIPAQMIAPKFTGRFNKGVDYIGDLSQFETEFDRDLCVVAHAIREFGLPETLKLSVRSGSDKFSIYPAINRCLDRHDAGLHLKTAGTTWLEEVIGLAEAGGDALEVAKEIYAAAHARFDELVAPCAPVVAIKKDHLPDPAELRGWDSERFAQTLRHEQSNPRYNPHLRQLLHVAFKVAAEMGDRYRDALKANAGTIGENVTENLFERHIRPIFG